ncbi:MAG: DNA mismatch repair protein MutS, partial [Mesorhizobium sp.]
MTRRIDRLSEDDRVLWNLVARTAKPLKGKAAVDIPDIGPDIADDTKPMLRDQAMAPAAATKARTQHVSYALDEPTLEKLSKGRLPIEGRVDLHGLSQDEAYSLLFSFLHRAHAGGIRYVLVITGKG